MQEEWEQDDNEAVEEILGRYPEARDFLPLLTAGTVQEFEDVAREVATRVRNIKGKETKQTPSSRNQEPKNERVSVKAAIEQKDWSGYLSSAWERQQREADDRA